MKRILATVFALLFIVCPLTGCVTTGHVEGYISEQIQADVFMFSKIATRISLAEANVLQDDLNVIKNYLLTLRVFFATEDDIDFIAARELVRTELPPQCRVYGYTIIDLLERYVGMYAANTEADRATIALIVYAGLSGALEAVEEFMVE